MRNTFQVLDEHRLEQVYGGDGDSLGLTTLVMGRPQTCQAVTVRLDDVFARSTDPTIASDTWLHWEGRLARADARVCPFD
jgi:hypothetical protein